MVQTPDLCAWFYTGYGVKTLPGVREAIEQKKWQEADAEIVVIANTLQSEAAVIDQATGELEKLGKYARWSFIEVSSEKERS